MSHSRPAAVAANAGMSDDDADASTADADVLDLTRAAGDPSALLFGFSVPSASGGGGVRRQGTSAAVKRNATERSRDWTPVAEMAAALGVAHITAVDPGRVNMGIFRICCRTLTVTHWQLVSLDDLCKEAQAKRPTHAFAVGERQTFSHDDHFHALFDWVRAEATGGGIFDSELTFVERQEFLREMASIQSIIQAAVISVKPPLQVYVDYDAGAPREANFLSPCQPIGADSVKTCYEPLFPRVAEKSSRPYKRRAFGVGDVSREGGVGSEQYRANKQNAKAYGWLIVPPEKIIEMLGDSMNPDSVQRFRRAKLDDVYDAMWIALYALETMLPCYYNRRRRCVGAPITLYGAAPQRYRRTYDALFEFMDAVGTDDANADEIRDTLFKAKEY